MSHQVTTKAWGCEILIANREFCGKVMHLHKGWRCSLHFHPVKDESFLVTRGRILVEVGEPGMAHPDAVDRSRMQVRELGPGESVDVPPMTLHRFTGLEDAEFVEFSTHDDPADSIRVEVSGRAP